MTQRRGIGQLENALYLAVSFPIPRGKGEKRREATKDKRHARILLNRSSSTVVDPQAPGQSAIATVTAITNSKLALARLKSSTFGAGVELLSYCCCYCLGSPVKSSLKPGYPSMKHTDALRCRGS